MFPDAMDGGIVRRWLLAARDALGDARAEIDALNVFPVPDGDTGTNMYLTVEGCVRGVADAVDDSVPALLGAASRGGFLAARGNSGVIFSQMFRGVARVLSQHEAPGPVEFADAMQAAAAAGYQAVHRPVEGTMLTVMEVAAQAARVAADEGGSLVRVAYAVVSAANEAVERTQEQHPVLRAAGVVDAGGRGLAVVLGAMDTAMTGRRQPPRRHTEPVGVTGVAAAPGADLVEDGPAYEVMYLLEADDAVVPRLTEQLDALGDSLLVVGGEGLWNVHVHADDVGAAIERGVEAGRPYRIRVTHFADQVGARPTARREHRTVVAVVAGPGLAAVVREVGATPVLIDPDRGLPATEELIEAVLGTGCSEVVLLPNHRDVLRSAQAAASEAGEHGIRVAVVPTRAQVQGLAALAVHDPSLPFDPDVVAMTSAAGHVRHGAVTVAAREAMTSAGRCVPGDVLGIVEGDFVLVRSPGDHAIAAAAVEVVERLLSLGGELVTAVVGEDTEPGLVESVRAAVQADHPAVDLVVLDGGQPRYPVLLGVE
jgi:hypothetical protein